MLHFVYNILGTYKLVIWDPRNINTFLQRAKSVNCSLPNEANSKILKPLRCHLLNPACKTILNLTNNTRHEKRWGQPDTVCRHSKCQSCRDPDSANSSVQQSLRLDYILTGIHHHPPELSMLLLLLTRPLTSCLRQHDVTAAAPSRRTRRRGRH